MAAWRYDFYFLVAKTIFYSLAALICKILFCHSQNKIHIFAPPCNILYVMKCIETVKHPKTSWESQAGDCGLVSHVWVLNATCIMTFYVYFSPYRNLVSIIMSPVLLFCSSIASFFSCSLKSQRRMPDRRLALDPSRKRLITTSKAVESRCCSRVERELSGNHLI